MMGSVRLPRLTFLAVSSLASRFDSQRRCIWLCRFMCRKGGVAGGTGLVGGRSGRSEYGHGVAPVEEDIENDDEYRDEWIYTSQHLSNDWTELAYCSIL